MIEKVNTTLAKFSAVGVYLLISFEFFYMASPFAIYFYSVYKPGLGLINKIPFLAWSTGFFMPHLVDDTKSVILNSITYAGAGIAIIGFLLFSICAFQIYYSKIFRKKAVTRGIYKYIRHPQYAAFALCSFGLLLLWPRYLTLFFYITLLFVYYWLARKEEKECTAKFGSEYLLYKEKTSMFFPLPARFRLPAKIARTLKTFNLFYIYIVVTAIVLVISVRIKKWSVEQLYTYYSSEGTWLSICEASNAEFRKLSELAGNSEILNSLIGKKSGDSSEIIIYVVPSDMYISEIPMVKPEGEECHVESNRRRNSETRIIITRGIHKSENRIYSGNQLLQKTLTLKPIAELWINPECDSIKKIVDLPQSERYTNIPEPIF